MILLPISRIQIQPSPNFMDEVMDDFGQMSGYKLNITKTQVLSPNYTPCKSIRQKYKLNWEAKSIKYLGVVTQEINKIYGTNYKIINVRLQKDLTKWSSLVMDRIEVVKMNVMPRLL